MVLSLVIYKFCHFFLLEFTAEHFVTTMVKQSAISLCPRSRDVTVAHNPDFYESNLNHLKKKQKKNKAHIIVEKNRAVVWLYSPS